MRTKRIFLTGRPGVGKSTVLLRTIELLRKHGYSVGGFVTPEVRICGRRVGFVVKDLVSGNELQFAGIGEIGRRLGKYGVNVEKFDCVALPALRYAMENCDVIAIDEIGRMELFSKAFERELGRVLAMEKPLIATLHRKLRRRFEDKGVVIEVTQANRSELPERLLKALLEDAPAGI